MSAPSPAPGLPISATAVPAAAIPTNRPASAAATAAPRREHRRLLLRLHAGLRPRERGRLGDGQRGRRARRGRWCDGRGGADRDAALRLRHRLAARRRQRRAPEVARRRIAVRRILRQRAGHHAVEALRRAALRRPRRRVVQVGEHRRGDGRARERRVAQQRRVEHAAERVDVGARVDPLALQLLGRGEVDRAQPLAGLGQLLLRAQQPREAEVAEVGVVARDQDVGGLDVAVHEPGGVRGVERRRHLRDDRPPPAPAPAAPRA